MFFISQLGEQDCAFACMKMMLANYHRDKNYLFLQCPEDRRYSFYDIKAIASTYGLQLIGVKINDPKELYMSKVKPIIVTLEKRRGEKHAVMLIKATPKYALIFDPQIGKHKMPTEVFLREWTKKAIIVDENFERKKCETLYPDFIDKKDKIVLPILQMISGVSLLLGTYFVNTAINYVLPIVFFTLFVIFELIFRWQLVNAMKRMDEQIFTYGFRKDELNYVNLYKNIEDYRYHALSTTPNFLGSTLIAIFIAVVMIMNDSLNFIYVVLPLALAAIHVFLYKPYFKEKSIQVLEKENEIAQVETDFQFKSKSVEAHSSAFQLGLNQNIYTYIEVAMLLITIVLTMAVSRVFNITYVLVYLCLSVFLKATFTKILEYSTQSDEFDKTKAKLINQIEFKQ